MSEARIDAVAARALQRLQADGALRQVDIAFSELLHDRLGASTPVALAGPARSALDAAATLMALKALSPRPDVVLAFQTYVSGAIAALADLTLGLPSVVWLRGENEYRFDRHPERWTPSVFAWRQARPMARSVRPSTVIVCSNSRQSCPLGEH